MDYEQFLTEEAARLRHAADSIEATIPELRQAAVAASLLRGKGVADPAVQSERQQAEHAARSAVANSCEEVTRLRESARVLDQVAAGGDRVLVAEQVVLIEGKRANA